MDSTSQKIIQYIAEIGDVLSKLNQIDTANQNVAKNLSGEFNKSFTKVGNGLGQISSKFKLDPVTNELKATGEVTKKFTEDLKGVDGQLTKFTETSKTSAKTGTTVTKSFSDIDKNTVSLGENMARLAKRAALTIPLWIALRAVMLGIPRALGEGVKGLVEFDRALQKIKRNLSGSTDEINTNIASIREEITKLSIATGTSTEDIADAIKKFATIGFNVEESLAGGIGATKLSILLFGEAGDTANAFARALKILIDRSAGAKTASEQMNEAFALTAELEKTNQFELDEVTQGLEKFATTAKVSNLSMQETLVLLATLGTAAVGGARGGTLLRTSFQKLVENLDVVTQQLGVKFNPQLDTTFDILLKVVDALSKLDQQSLIAVETTGALADIFGGVRGSLPIQALVALNGQLKANLSVTGDTVKFNKSVSDVLESEAKSADRLKNNIKELKKAFVETLIGGEKLHGIIKGLADDTGNAIPAIQGTADAIRNLAIALTLLSAPALLGGAAGLGVKLGTSIAGGLQKVALATVLSNQLISAVSLMGPVGQRIGLALATGIGASIVSVAGTGLIFGVLANALINTLSDIKLRKVNIDNKSLIDASEQMLKVMRGELSKSELDLLLKTKLNDDSIKTIHEQIVKLLQKESESPDVAVRVPLRIEATGEELQAIQDLLIKSQVDRLRNEGALESQALKFEASLLRQYGLEQDALKILERQLKIQEEKTKEQRLQSELGNESIKLFRIAQESGTNVAKKIGDVLSGDIDFSTFIRAGGEAVDVFKKEFADLFENKQAEAFFKGESIPGGNNLRGGSRINIAEESIRGTSTTQAQLEVARAIEQFTTIKNSLLPNTSSTDNNTKAINDNTAALLKNIPVAKGTITNADLAGPGVNQKLLDSNLEAARRGIAEFNRQQIQPNSFRAPGVPAPTLASLVPTTLPAEQRGIKFDSGALNINISSSVSKEEAQKLVDETFVRMGTPGTKENSQVKTVINRF